jgi:hypothetical protein
MQEMAVWTFVLGFTYFASQAIAEPFDLSSATTVVLWMALYVSLGVADSECGSDE